jgi:hypothetical protein
LYQKADGLSDVCCEVTVLLYKKNIPSHVQDKVIFPATAKIMVTYSSGTAVKGRVEMQLKLQLLLVGGALW